MKIAKFFRTALFINHLWWLLLKKQTIDASFPSTNTAKNVTSYLRFKPVKLRQAGIFNDLGKLNKTTFNISEINPIIAERIQPTKKNNNSCYQPLLPSSIKNISGIHKCDLDLVMQLSNDKVSFFPNTQIPKTIKIN